MCPNCKLGYVGQMCKSFQIRFSEHFRDFKYVNKSKFAQHLLQKNHSTGPIDSIMKVLNQQRKITIK